MATTTELPTADCNNYDYVIVGGGTAGTNHRARSNHISTNMNRLCHCIATRRISTSQEDAAN